MINWEILKYQVALYIKALKLASGLLFWYLLYLPTYFFWCIFGRKEFIEDYPSLNKIQDKMIRIIENNYDVMTYILSFKLARKVIKL